MQYEEALQRQKDDGEQHKPDTKTNERLQKSEQARIEVEAIQHGEEECGARIGPKDGVRRVIRGLAERDSANLFCPICIKAVFTAVRRCKMGRVGGFPLDGWGRLNMCAKYFRFEPGEFRALARIAGQIWK